MYLHTCQLNSWLHKMYGGFAMTLWQTAMRSKRLFPRMGIYYRDDDKRSRSPVMRMSFHIPTRSSFRSFTLQQSTFIQEIFFEKQFFKNRVFLPLIRLHSPISKYVLNLLMCIISVQFVVYYIFVYFCVYCIDTFPWLDSYALICY
jgi:hypothetical protein